MIATPHIGGSTEEAQEIVGVRIAEQVVEYLQHGVAINAVNMPALSPEQYRDSAVRHAGGAAGQLRRARLNGQSEAVRLIYFGRIAEQNTNLMRNAGVAGVLNRSLSRKANLVNALQLAAERGWAVEERHEKRETHIDTIRLELEYRFGPHGGRRRGDPGQAAAGRSRRHLLRSAARRTPDVPEERRRARA